jgi:hypothetical protein
VAIGVGVGVGVGVGETVGVGVGEGWLTTRRGEITQPAISRNNNKIEPPIIASRSIRQCRFGILELMLSRAALLP